MGATWKGRCPIPQREDAVVPRQPREGVLPLFRVKQGGDVIKFVELHEKVAFPEAVRMLAARFGLAIPDDSEARDESTSAAEREALLKVHEGAATWFQQQLAGPAGARMRQQLDGADQAGKQRAARAGCAPSTRDGLKSVSARAGDRVAASPAQRPGDAARQRRGRGPVSWPVDDPHLPRQRISDWFGGRATEPDQVPKYLNSPETPIYSKSRTLYGLHLANQPSASWGGRSWWKASSTSRGWCRPAARRRWPPADSAYAPAGPAFARFSDRRAQLRP